MSMRNWCVGSSALNHLLIMFKAFAASCSVLSGFLVNVLILVLMLGLIVPTSCAQSGYQMTAVLNKSAIILPCLVTNVSSARWLFSFLPPSKNASKQLLSNGEYIYGFSEKTIRSGDYRGQYDLVIYRIQFKNAGTYYCQEAQTNMAIIELGVFGEYSLVHSPIVYVYVSYIKLNIISFS